MSKSPLFLMQQVELTFIMHLKEERYMIKKDTHL